MVARGVLQRLIPGPAKAGLESPQPEKGQLSFSQSYLPSEDHGTLSVSHWIHRELRKIKLGDHGAKRLKKTVCIAEVRMPWLPIVSVYHNTIGGVLRDSELLNRQAKRVRITFGHESTFRGSGCRRRHPLVWSDGVRGTGRGDIGFALSYRPGERTRCDLRHIFPASEFARCGRRHEIGDELARKSVAILQCCRLKRGNCNFCHCSVRARTCTLALLSTLPLSNFAFRWRSECVVVCPSSAQYSSS